MRLRVRSTSILKLLLVVTVAAVILTIAHRYSKDNTLSWKCKHAPNSGKVYSDDATANSGLENSDKQKTATTTSRQYPYRYIMNNPEKCKTDYRLKLVMMVISAPSNNSSRLAIRRTWGTASFRTDVAMVFLLGATNDTCLQKTIVEENKLYADIVQEDFTDSYQNLTLKSVALLRWVNSFCQNAEFVLKVDDDNFVHVPNLVMYLEMITSTSKTIFGNLLKKGIPERDNTSKWYVSKEDYKCEVYPVYLEGPAYVMTQDCVEELLNATRIVKPIAIEDVYITGLCAEHANISRHHHPQFVGNMNSFYLHIYMYYTSTYRNIFTAHKVPYTSYINIWQIVNNR